MTSSSSSSSSCHSSNTSSMSATHALEPLAARGRRCRSSPTDRRVDLDLGVGPLRVEGCGRRGSSASNGDAHPSARGRDRSSRALASNAVAGAVNLYSDTQTRPSDGMRRAIAAAEVGDEQRREDPTTRRLEERVAELLGHEAGLFLPSGTMCNQIALRLHARPGGDEVILDRTAHPIIAEAGGPAWNAGLMIHALDGEGGIFSGDQVRAAVRADEPLPAALAARVGRADDQHGRRARLAARERARGARGGARARPAHPHGRRAADERGGRVRRVRGRVRGRLRHRLARLHEGPRRARRRRAVRLGGADRGGLALQADDGRLDAPVGHHRRRAACTRSTTTSSGSPRTTRTPACWPTASPSSAAT